MALDQCSESLCLTLLRIATIAPLDGVGVIGTKERRHQADASLQVTRLCDIIEARIVHDRWCGAILLGKSGIPQLLHRVRRGGAHIMLQPQRMPHLVSRHIPHRLAHQAVRQLIRTHPRIYGTGLDQPPVVEQRGDIVVPDHIRTEDLPTPRIDIGGTHRIGDMGGGILDAREAQIIGIKVRHLLLGRVHPGTDGIAEACCPKGALPVAYAVQNSLTPLGWKSGVDIEGDRLHRIDHLTTSISDAIRRLQPPAVDDLIPLDTILVGGVVAPAGGEVPDPAVCSAGSHRAIRQQNHRPMDLYRGEVPATPIRSDTLHLHSPLKGAHPANVRPSAHRATERWRKWILALKEGLPIEE